MFGSGCVRTTTTLPSRSRHPPRDTHNVSNLLGRLCSWHVSFSNVTSRTIFADGRGATSMYTLACSDCQSDSQAQPLSHSLTHTNMVLLFYCCNYTYVYVIYICIYMYYNNYMYISLADSLTQSVLTSCRYIHGGLLLSTEEDDASTRNTRCNGRCGSKHGTLAWDVGTEKGSVHVNSKHYGGDDDGAHLKVLGDMWSLDMSTPQLTWKEVRTLYDACVIAWHVCVYRIVLYSSRSCNQCSFCKFCVEGLLPSTIANPVDNILREAGNGIVTLTQIIYTHTHTHTHTHIHTYTYTYTHTHAHTHTHTANRGCYL